MKFQSKKMLPPIFLAALVVIPFTSSVEAEEEKQHRHKNYHMSADKMIEKADTDGDGVISKEEFVAFHMNKTERRFEKIDLNGDGTIERSELEAAKEQWKERKKAGKKHWKKHKDKHYED